MSSLNVPRCYKHYIYGLSRREFDSSRPSLSLVFKPVIMECADDLELNRDMLCVIYDSHNMYIRIYYFDEQLYRSDEESGGRRGPMETRPRQLPYYDCCMEIYGKMKELLL